MANFPWHYRAYGLHLSSDFELPELTPLSPAPGVLPAPDIWIERGETITPATLERAAQENTALEFGARRSRLLFQVARFTISEGRRVTVEPMEGQDAASWRVALLGSVMAVLLEQRDLFVLHAGALAFDAGAAAFLGDKGQGKSTLNAALSGAGYPLLSDDVVGLEMPRSAPSGVAAAGSAAAGSAAAAGAFGLPLVWPGFSQIKLSPESLRAATGENPDEWPAVAPDFADFDKRSFRAPLAPDPLPLRALFVLHWASETEVAQDDGGLWARRLGAPQALTQIIPHTFGARFGPGYLQGERRKTHFLDCAQVVNRCAVWRLSRPRDLSLLPATVELIARIMAEPDAARAS